MMKWLTKLLGFCGTIVARVECGDGRKMRVKFKECEIIGHDEKEVGEFLKRHFYLNTGIIVTKMEIVGYIKE